VRGVAPFGAGLHLREDPARWGEREVAEALAAAGARDVRVAAAEPSLEDVFLAVVDRGGRAEGAA
jgi:ABC-2 type transport system ATP-binding protein